MVDRIEGRPDIPLPKPPIKRREPPPVKVEEQPRPEPSRREKLAEIDNSRRRRVDIKA